MTNNAKSRLTSTAPGRINIIGEHIDYHGGLVLPAATHYETKFLLQKRETGNHNAIIKAEATQEEFLLPLNGHEGIYDSWKGYVFGVVRELQKLGGRIGAFEAEFSGNVPIGAGMSSSRFTDLQLGQWAEYTIRFRIHPSSTGPCRPIGRAQLCWHQMWDYGSICICNGQKEPMHIA